MFLVIDCVGEFSIMFSVSDFESLLIESVIIMVVKDEDLGIVLLM